MSDWLEYVILAIIVAGFGLVLWRGGQANPVTTGQISRRLGRLEQQTNLLETKAEELEGRVADMSAEMATQKDLLRLEIQINSLAAIAEKSWHAIDRMQNYWVEIGIGKR